MNLTTVNKYSIFISVFLYCYLGMASADTIGHYMNIANNIPKMEMKADQQAQAWARSARNVLIITSESIAETIMEANEMAKKQKAPLFCLSATDRLSADKMDALIQQTYQEMASKQSNVDNKNVSQVAWAAVKKAYPCSGSTTQKTSSKMQHMNALFKD